MLILRDGRESARKCSLTPLRGRAAIQFLSYSRERRVPCAGRILLDPTAPPLEARDRAALESRSQPASVGLLLLDCAWRRVGALRAVLDGEVVPRALPPLTSAYPRQSRLFSDPAQGLASVEALVAALWLLGDRRLDLLDGYHWRDEFIQRNAAWFAAH